MEAWLVINMLFGAVGMGYFVYGKKEQKGIALFCGIALCVFPYFISQIWLMLIAGAAFIILPFLLPY